MKRRDKGFGCVSEILSILNEIPLGKYRIHIALILRQAMLINGMLGSIEAWSDIKEADLKLLEDVDEFLLRSVFKAHRKTPIEFLHLETGTIPIRFIVASRRLNYLHTILSREKSELTQRVYQAQKSKPSKGDWINLVRKDCDELLIIFDEILITSMSKNKFKFFVKKQVQNAAFSYLRNLQNSHSKVKNIVYEKLAPQEYIKSTLFKDEDIETIFSLRSQMIPEEIQKKI